MESLGNHVKIKYPLKTSYRVKYHMKYLSLVTETERVTILGSGERYVLPVSFSRWVGDNATLAKQVPKSGLKVTNSHSLHHKMYLFVSFPFHDMVAWRSPNLPATKSFKNSFTYTSCIHTHGISLNKETWGNPSPRMHTK